MGWSATRNIIPSEERGRKSTKNKLSNSIILSDKSALSLKRNSKSGQRNVKSAVSLCTFPYLLPDLVEKQKKIYKTVMGKFSYKTLG